MDEQGTAAQDTDVCVSGARQLPALRQGAHSVYCVPAEDVRHLRECYKHLSPVFLTGGGNVCDSWQLTRVVIPKNLRKSRQQKAELIVHHVGRVMTFHTQPILCTTAPFGMHQMAPNSLCAVGAQATSWVELRFPAPYCKVAYWLGRESQLAQNSSLCKAACKE